MDPDPIKPAFGRSIEGLGVDAHLADAARRAVGGRLAAVLSLYPLVHEHGADEARPIHRLRVATRRADAALTVFRPVLPRKKTRRVRIHLRELRSAASAVRAADVHAGMLLALVDATPIHDAARPAIALAAGMTIADRQHAFAHELSGFAEAPRRRLHRHASGLLDALEEETVVGVFGPVARSAVHRAVERARAAAAADLTDPPRLHRLRIALKRLRYTIEAIGDAAPALGADRVYPPLLEAQDRFGHVNDAQELTGWITGLRDRLSAGPVDLPVSILESLDTLARDQRRRAEEAHRALLAWWPGSDLRAALHADDFSRHEDHA